MKKLIGAVATLLLLLLSGLAHSAYWQGQTYAPPSDNPNLRQENFFGLTGSAWQTPSNYYLPGMGNPAISTSDYYHIMGAEWFRPYDLLDSACGSAGSSIAAANGRYVWFITPDHGAGFPWTDGLGLYMGFSNDPGVPPSTVRQIYTGWQYTALAPTATVTASISGNNLTVTAITGWLSPNSASAVTGAGVTQALITSQSSGTPGKTGVYVINGSPQTVGSQTMTISQPGFGVGQIVNLVCNPDDATYPFYLYSEGSNGNSGNETGLIKSSDLVTFTDAVPSHIGLEYGSVSGYQSVFRTGVNQWFSIGLLGLRPPDFNGLYGTGKWTSTDGVIWNPGTPSDLINTCLPANASGTPGALPCTGATVLQGSRSGVPSKVTVGGQDYAIVGNSTVLSGTRIGNQWISRVPIDANFNALSSPATVNISKAYAGQYPDQTYSNAISAYVEDGIIHYYMQLGYPPSANPGATVDARILDNGGACNLTQAVFNITNSSIAPGSPPTLTIGTTPPYPIKTNMQILAATNLSDRVFITGQLTGPAGGAGTYTTSASSQTIPNGTITLTTCGGLWQQGIDYYTEVADATAAASAAPVGLRATCANGTASLTWYNALPHSNYRLYRGTSAGSQPTLIGDVTGTSTTNAPGGTGVYYFKLVTMNSGEQKSRVVPVYCSSSIYPEVNAHLLRASLAGADMSTCDATWMDNFYGWLTSNSLKSSLLFASDVKFCVAKTSSVITKIFDMGTTRLPRGGDLTPRTSNTTYSATGVNSKPSWVAANNTDYLAYGNGRANQIQRKREVTMYAAYQKPGTQPITPFISGAFGTTIELRHTSGSPGSASFIVCDGTPTCTPATSNFSSATAVNSLTGTYSATNGLIAYANAVAGTPITTLVIPSPTINPSDTLTGTIGTPGNMPTLSSGGDGSYLVAATSSGGGPSTTTYSIFGNAALYNGVFQMVLDKELTSSQVSSLDTLVKTTR